MKAIGVPLKERGLAQVSINLTDFEITPLDRVFEAVRLEAQSRGYEIVSTEIVSLVPAKALEMIAGFDLRLEKFSPAQVLENRLAAALAHPASGTAPDKAPDEAPPEALDQFIAWFDGLAQGNRPTSVILFSIAALLVLSAVSALLSYLQRFLAALIGHQLTARLRRTLFEHLERLSLDWHGKQKKGDLIQRITGDITNIEKLVTDGLVDLLAGLLTLLGVAAVMALVSLQFTLIAQSLS